MKKLPKVTHSGRVNIRGNDIDVVVLENGSRLIVESSEKVVSNIPDFIGNVVTTSFIEVGSQQTKQYKVEYQDLNGTNRIGYDITVILDVADKCIEYAGDLRENGIEITKPQKEIVEFSWDLMVYLACIGMISLIDESTGYQNIRESDALRKIEPTKA